MNQKDLIINGDIRAVAKLMRDIDDGFISAIDELKNLFPYTGNAYIVGITGPPGAGKSTLVDQMISVYRKRSMKVGVVAIDPTSPFTGGAILGDRIRMNRHADDPEVFIRSLATRGYLGGLSRSTADVVSVLDAMGKDVIIIETVGVGQDEIDIVRMAHTTVVVMVPGMGDDIQAIKAGILEIGDVFVVNKADRDDADRTARDLTTMLEMNPNKVDDDWQPLVLKTEANRNIGINDLVDELDRHREYIFSSGAIADYIEDKLSKQFLEILRDRLFTDVYRHIETNGNYRQLVGEIIAKTTDPYSAVEKVLSEYYIRQ